ncbi:YihY/virulence factor BrkB family protein [Fluviicola taffensis]|uniref:Ribonuclease BN n=1 Tax=Fluviicola taffensis (strain DSM 16823 / NCIMB 13979 / RW262) TaxID=755732 RepID=F2IDY8_FLUTR|nr:YihY/virulence factor BrkB family protein [Fluviicola taffensis]AEA45552.1 ribonuclease BN [Fluviicola taffensis DSM 16823]
MDSKRKVPKLSWKEVLQLFKTTFVEFFGEKSFFHGAALAYYAVFAIIPIIYLAVISFGSIMGQEAILKLIKTLLEEQVGMKDSSGILDFLSEVHFEKSSVILNIVGIIALMFSSSALISSLRMSINEFYDIHVKIDDRKTQILYTILIKLGSVFMLAVFGISIVLLYTGETIFMSISGELYESLHLQQKWIMNLIEHLVAIGINTILFSIVYKYLHDGKVLWKLALSGGLLTSCLLYVGQIGLKFYLTKYFFGSQMGIAGTLLIFLAWMYYSSQIIFLGAKFVKVYSEVIGRPITFEVHRFLQKMHQKKKE